jgi:molybdate transport system substrate-binding protein
VPRTIVAIALLLAATSARADEITLVAPGGIRAAIDKLIPEFERASGHRVKATFGSGGGTKAQVVRGEPFDVPVVQPPLAEVIASGHVDARTQTALASVAVAVAVRKGAAHPDISTAAAVKRMLLAAKAIAYPDASAGAAAGVSFERTLALLGIADQMRPKIRRAQGGAGAMALLARGEIDIGLTFLSEITDPGVETVGVLPAEISTPTELVGFVSANTRSPEAARALLRFLSSAQADATYRASGLQPAASREPRDVQEVRAFMQRVAVEGRRHLASIWRRNRD